MAEEQGSAAVLIQDSDVSKHEKLSFSMMLQIHLSRISQSRSSLTTGGNYDEKLITYNEQVELLEDFLAGYQDDKYKTDISTVENYTTDPMAHQPSADNQILVLDKIAASKYIRERMKAIMKLMARKNLLLQEDTTGDI